MNHEEFFIYKSIVKDMTEGVLTINMQGRITSINAASNRILSLEEDICGMPFAQVFFKHEENDAFNQTILNAVYERTVAHNEIVDFYNGETSKKLFVSTSFLHDGDNKIGVVAVINDVTELIALKDAIKAMEHIKLLNSELQRRNEFIKKMFGRYLSDEIVEKVLEQQTNIKIGGEKKCVTVMFSDLRSFTSISENMEAHALIKMLNAYLERMIAVIQRHNGTILEFIGDAIVAVFGAPIELPSAQTDAVRCAIEMQRAMADVNEYNLKMGYEHLEMGIGIHTGDVIIGNIGSEKKLKYDIIGSNVNLASRIETYTLGGQVLISEATKNGVVGDLSIRSSRSVLPKGVKNTITIYEVGALDKIEVPNLRGQLKELLEPCRVLVRIIDGKDVSGSACPAKVTHFCQNEARISGVEAEYGKNVQLECENEKMFAKVIECGDGYIGIHFSHCKITSLEKAPTL
ncbi:MAG: adenylate/guanylate cyclase domain-containing protein [Clostridia bacterium]|nr:adenylate/guanylate cyclase domain-containing protein [Clostridia bacterium]